jgi:hypothetical protein
MNTRGVMRMVACIGLAMASMCYEASSEELKEAAYSLRVLQNGSNGREILQAGESRMLTASVRNDSAVPVAVAKVLLSNCGCAGGTMTPEVLQPGEIGRITFRPSTGGLKSGIGTTRFAIRTRDEKVAAVKGEATYVIRRDVGVMPASIDLGVVPSGTAFEKSLQLMITSSEQPASVLASTELPDVRVAVSAVPSGQATRGKGDLPGRAYDVRMSGLAPQQSGHFTGQIRLTLKGYQGRDRVFEVPVAGRVPEQVEVSPPQLFLGYIRGASNIAKDVAISYPTGQNLTVDSVKGAQFSDVQYTVKQIADGKLQVALGLKLDAAQVRTGSSLLQINVRLNGVPMTLQVMCVCVGNNS